MFYFDRKIIHFSQSSMRIPSRGSLACCCDVSNTVINKKFKGGFRIKAPPATAWVCLPCCDAPLNCNPIGIKVVSEQILMRDKITCRLFTVPAILPVMIKH